MEKLPIRFTSQQFGLLQSLINEMFQNDQVRSGPFGGQVVALRPKFLTLSDVNLTERERMFLLGVLQDVNITSRSPFVQSQYGVTMKLQSPTPLDDPYQSQTQLSSATSTMGNRFQDNRAYQSSSLQGSYLAMWQVFKQCMALLGQAPPPPYPVEPAVGPTGDTGSISSGRPNVDPDNRIIQQRDDQLTG